MASKHQDNKTTKSVIRLLGQIFDGISRAKSQDAKFRVAIDKIARFTGWPVAHVYFWNTETELLIPSGIWHLKNKNKFKGFKDLTEKTVFKSGEGLPGRVLASKKALWIANLQDDFNFPRAKAGVDIGINAGIGIPVFHGDEVFAVLEFFFPEALETDTFLLDLLEEVGGILGYFPDLQKAEEKAMLAEKTLKESEKFQQKTLDTMYEGVVVIDAQGHIISINRAASRIFKYSKKDLIGQTFSLLFPEDVREIHKKEFIKFLKTGKGKFIGVGKTEFNGLRKNGEIFNLEIAVEPLDDGDKRVFVATFNDTTTRKEAETELIELQERLSLITENTNDIITLRDAEAKVLYVSPSFERHLGRHPDEHIGTFSETTPVHPDEVETLKTWKREVFKEGKRFIDVFRVKAKNGKYVWFQSETEPIKDDNGKVTGAVTVSRNFTKQKEAETKLLKLQERLSLITDNVSDIITLRNEKGKIIYLSPSFNRHLGYDPEEFMNNRLYQNIIHPDDREYYLAEWQKKNFEDGEPFTFHLRLRNINGDYIWFESQSRPIKNEANEVIAAVTVSRNISQQRAMQDQLRQAKKMEAVGQLTGGVAHEFNNILTTILGSLRIFETLEMDKNTKECLDFTISAARQGAELTEQLLKFSRKEVLEPEILNPNLMFGELTHLLELACGKTTRFRFKPATENMYINVDRHELQGALIALCTNSKEATQATGGLVKCQICKATVKQGVNESGEIPSGDYCQITIADTGKGMSPDVLEKALDPFFTTKAVGEGAGLGLSSVYGFVQQSQGFVQMDSEPGFGTSVSMYFPLVDAEPTLQAEEDAIANKLPTTVLFVEDDAKQILLSTKALEGLSDNVLVAKSFEEAKKIIKEEKDISLLISQMKIAGNDAGYQLVQEFNSKFRNGKLILIDAQPHNAQNAIDKSTLLGEVLIGPYTLSSLIVKTDNLLNASTG